MSDIGKNIFYFMAVEMMMILLFWGIPNTTARLLADIGMTLSYYPFVKAWFVIITIINFYLNLALPISKPKGNGIKANRGIKK